MPGVLMAFAEISGFVDSRLFFVGWYYQVAGLRSLERDTVASPDK
jgi:hypothetical protein